jgi:hypothetical protein
MINKNLVEFHVVNGRRVFSDYRRALAQAKLWGGEVRTLPKFSQVSKDWEQTNGFELIEWGNPATYRTKPKPQSLSSERGKLERQEYVLSPLQAVMMMREYYEN